VRSYDLAGVESFREDAFELVPYLGFGFAGFEVDQLMEGFNPSIGFLIALREIVYSIAYFAGFFEEVDACEDAEDAANTVKSAAAAHEEDEENFVCSAGDRFEY
jgi:hypothetical protein